MWLLRMSPRCAWWSTSTPKPAHPPLCVMWLSVSSKPRPPCTFSTGPNALEAIWVTFRREALNPARPIISMTATPERLVLSEIDASRSEVLSPTTMALP